MELSQTIGKDEAEVEEKFERLEVVQTEFDEIIESFEKRLQELED